MPLIHSVIEECKALNCQCSKCVNLEKICCVLHKKLSCPDEKGYDPNYKCPDFVAREGMQLDAARNPQQV